MLKEIVTVPDEILKKISDPIEKVGINEKKQAMALINPVIKNLSTDMSVYEEGCLSIPETFIEIERPKICEVEYVDEKGSKKNLKCDGLLSTCVQHEINHLDGKLIIYRN